MSRRQRRDRVTNPQSGAFATVSADYFHLVGELYRLSKNAAASSSDCVPWIYAGLPILLSGVEAYLIEHQHLLRSPAAEKRAGFDGLKAVLGEYKLSETLSDDVCTLIEIRNEIVHPIALPLREQNWECLGRLYKLGLLRDIGSETAPCGENPSPPVHHCPEPPRSGYEMLSRISSHKLFEWSIGRICDLLVAIAKSDPQREWIFQGLASNLSRVLGEHRIETAPTSR